MKLLRRVFAKELADTLRDRRTIFTVFFTSVLMGPVALFLLAEFIGQTEKQADRKSVV